jgi:PAS domain-containing protein
MAGGLVPDASQLANVRSRVAWWGRQRSRPVRVLIGVLAPVAVTAAFLPLNDAGRYRPSTLLVAVVAVVALLGGRASAVTATGTATLALWIAILPPRWSLRIDSRADRASLVVFVVAALGVVTLVTLLSRTRAKLENERTEVNLLFDRLPVGIAVFDHDVRFRRVNATLAAIDGISAAAYLGRLPAELSELAGNTLEPSVRRVLASGLPVVDELVSRDVPGAPSFRMSFFPVETLEGAAVGAVIEDVTITVAHEQRERVIATCALRLAEAVSIETVGEIALEVLTKRTHARGSLSTVSVERATVEVTVIDGYPSAAASAGPLLRWPLGESNPITDAARDATWVEVTDHNTLQGKNPDCWFGDLDASLAPADEAMVCIPLFDLRTTTPRTPLAVLQLGWSDRRDQQELDREFVSRIASLAELALSRLRVAETEADDRFRSVLNSMPDNVAVTEAVRDEAGRIVDFEIRFANQSSIDGAGRGAGDMIGRRVLDLYPNIVASGLFDQYVSVVETGKPVVLTTPYAEQLADGQLIEGSWTVQATRHGDGYIAATRDITDQVRAERELQAAHEAVLLARVAVETLQAAALPASLPPVRGLTFAARYVAATPAPLGGDWYDVFPLEDGRVGLVIADVVGHGTAAASSMVQMRNKLRGAAFDGRGPDVVLRQLNAMACRSEAMLTCCYVIVDAASGELEWANAGHPPPLVHGNDQIRWLSEPSKVMLGVTTSARYQTGRTQLQRGGVIVLYTDGLVERRERSIDDGVSLLGAVVERFRAQPPEQLATGILEAMTTPPLADDLCVLVAKLSSG